LPFRSDSAEQKLPRISLIGFQRHHQFPTYKPLL